LAPADECYCGNAVANANVLATDGGCNMECTGNATEICGGSNRINIYSYSNGGVVTSTTTPTTAAPTTSSTAPAGLTYMGCYTDGGATRALTNQIWTIPGASMTIELCAAACKTAGYSLAGTEYSMEPLFFKKINPRNL